MIQPRVSRDWIIVTVRSWYSFFSALRVLQPRRKKTARFQIFSCNVRKSSTLYSAESTRRPARRMARKRASPRMKQTKCFIFFKNWKSEKSGICCRATCMHELTHDLQISTARRRETRMEAEELTAV